MRKVRASLQEILEAFSTGGMEEMTNYLDLQTGEVILMMEADYSIFWDEFEEEDEGGEEDERQRFEKWVQSSDSVPDWERDSLLLTYDIKNDTEGRFLEIPTRESHDAYRVMEAFTDSVEDKHLRELLDLALDGRGAFRRFKDVLVRYPEERQRYLDMENESQRKAALEWLEDEGIELEEP